MMELMFQVNRIISLFFITCVCVLVVQSCPTLRTIARQAPLSMEFSRQEYWSGLLFPSPQGLPDPGIKAWFLHHRQILYHLSYRAVLFIIY